MVAAVLGFSASGGVDPRSADRPAAVQEPAAPTPVTETERAARALGADPLRDAALVPGGWLIDSAQEGSGQVRLTQIGPDGGERDLLLSAAQVGPHWISYVGGDGSRRVALDAVSIPTGNGPPADAVVATAVGRTFITVTIVDGWLLTVEMPRGVDRAAALDLAAQILAPAI